MHQAVLLREVVDLVRIPERGIYVDGTLGAGGHARAILEKAGPGARLLGIDRDAESLARTRERLADLADRITLLHGNFSDMLTLAHQSGVESADGILLDLGFSSDQMDDASRGLSFQQDGPLDMRLDRSEPRTAADLVNELPEGELADLIFELGDERDARRIARAIVAARARSAIRTTGQLADVVASAKRGPRGKIHPATQVFQALRIAVNREMEALDRGLEAALALVKPGGRVGVISFHSGEDRRVKRCFAAHAGRWESLEQGGERWVGLEPRVTLVTRKPVTAAEDEVRDNPRARSAKLRVAERMKRDGEEQEQAA